MNTYYSIPHAAFTLWAGPATQRGKRLYPGKPPRHSPLPKRSRDASRFRTAVIDILSGIEICETEHGYHCAWQRIGNLREHFNLPECYHSWANGYMDCKQAEWYRSKVEFLYVMPDGRKVAYSKQHGSAPLATPEEREIIHSYGPTSPETAGHYWIKSGRAFH